MENQNYYNRPEGKESYDHVAANRDKLVGAVNDAISVETERYLNRKKS